MALSAIVAASYLFAPVTATSLLARQTEAESYCTNYNLSLALTYTPGPVQGVGGLRLGQQTWQLSIDDSIAGYKQTIAGFGATVTDATVLTFNTLNASALDTLLETLMGNSGLRFSLMRHTIGSSDMSLTAYNYDENGGKPDLTLAHFSLGPQGTAMAQLLAKMRMKVPWLTNLGSLWSPPGWMKKNGMFVGTTDGNNLLDTYLNDTEPNYAKQYAQYFIKYIKAFNDLGVFVNSITLQNEPLWSSSGYPTMYLYAYEQAQLIKNYVAPAFIKAGLNTTIWTHDFNTDLPAYAQTVLDEAGNWTNTVAWHCYDLSLDWTSMSIFQRRNPNVTQYMNECWTPETTIYNWFQAANFTMGSVQNWAAGVIAWNLGTDSTYGPRMPGGCDGCKGVVTINDNSTYTLNIAAYLMGQFSRFMPRNAIILRGAGSAANKTAEGVHSVASLNPDRTRTVVIMNTFSKDVFVTLRTTSGQLWSNNVVARSVVTWILPPASAGGGVF